jgi:uncharacterized protein
VELGGGVVSAKRKRRWFLPETPDVLGMLRAQAEVTMQGLALFARWAHGEEGLSHEVRDAEHRADISKAELIAALREAFTTPLQPEDIFELSRGLDEVMNGAKDTVRESEALAMPPNAELAAMADLIAAGASDLRDAFAGFGHDPAAADVAAAAATKTQRRLERVYRTAMSDLAGSENMREVVGRGELYRRLMRMSDEILLVADRVGYANVKEA